MQNDILKRAILDFRRFHALKATPNRPVESVGLGTPGIFTVVCGVGHSNNSHGSLWGCALQGFSRDSHGSLRGWALQGFLRDFHSSLWGWALQGVSRDSTVVCGVGTLEILTGFSRGILTVVCGVGQSAGLGTPGILTVVGHSRDSHRGFSR